MTIAPARTAADAKRSLHCVLIRFIEFISMRVVTHGTSDADGANAVVFACIAESRRRFLSLVECRNQIRLREFVAHMGILYMLLESGEADEVATVPARSAQR
jgi:hypothetical protein